jgi:hypothetical protein
MRSRAPGVVAPATLDVGKIVTNLTARSRLAAGFRFRGIVLQLQKYIALITLGAASLSWSQAPAQKSRPSATKPKASATQKAAPAQKKLGPQQKFAMDVVQSAVALPQPDPQDRLRVLASAANVILPVDKNLSKQFAKEGAQIEADLIRSGNEPVVSVLAQGYFDCGTSAQFVDSIPTQAVAKAEDSLIGIITNCKKEGFEPAKRKLMTALNDGVIAPRALMALVEADGAKSRWSQDVFARMFSTLPAPDSEAARQEAPNFAAMYLRMAPEIEKDAAKDTGLKFLEWLNKAPESNERQMAINMTVGQMKQTLGEEDFNKALETNVIARQVASLEGQPAEVSHPEEESVSVMGAMENNGSDQSEQISKLAPSLRAREAAAHGFATGTAGDRKSADHYFDIAFSAADEVWTNRDKQKDAPAVVEEVSEAAAQVDAVAALKRSQALTDPSAQAISMLAVARTVLGREDAPTAENAPPPRNPASPK